MNNFNINDENFINSEIYKSFIEKNPSTGNLKIRAFAASQAIPISGLRVVVRKNVENNNVVFFDGYTNSSGVIEKISLPAPQLDTSNLDVPNYTEYEIVTTYMPDNINGLYKVNIYENVCVVQNINIVPDMKIGGF